MRVLLLMIALSLTAFAQQPEVRKLPDGEAVITTTGAKIDLTGMPVFSGVNPLKEVSIETAQGFLGLQIYVDVEVEGKKTRLYLFASPEAAKALRDGLNVAFPQDRTLTNTRAKIAPLVLRDNNGLADGMAQAPTGEPRFFQYGPVPVQSMVKLFGYGLHGAGALVVKLTMAASEFILPVTVSRDPFFKIDAVAFRLPADVHGKVAAEVIGARGRSNAVMFEVE